MSVPFSNTKLRVPRGFQNLLEGLAREVLRQQPEDVYSFAAKYFDELLHIRNGGGSDPAKIGAHLEDRFYNNNSFQNPDVDPSNVEHQQAALSIQTKYRQYHAKKEVRNMREEQAAVTLQAGIRGYNARKEIDELRKGEPNKEVGAPEEEEIDIDLNDPEVNAAATKIQASFKGHKARKEVQAIKEQNVTDTRLAAEAEAETTEPDIDIDLDDPEVANAAVKIQSNFRGYKTRKMNKKDSKTEEAAKVEEKKPDEEEIDIDLNDPEVANAATKIQANFRGYKVRKDTKSKSETEAEEEKEEATAVAVEEKKDDEEEIDIDLNDPETAKAAVKIQASFRGHKTRKEMKKGSKEEGEGAVEEGEATDAAAEDVEEQTEEQEPEEETAPAEADTVDEASAESETVDEAPAEAEPVDEAPSSSSSSSSTTTSSSSSRMWIWI